MSEAAATFAVEGECSIYRAAELAQALQQWLATLQTQQAVYLDLSGVSEMDSAGLQLLLSLQRTAFEQQRAFQLVAASDAAQEVLRLSALESLLPDADASSSAMAALRL